MAKKNFQMSLEALTPIFIGSGEKLLKKEYICVPSKSEEVKILVPNLSKLYLFFENLGIGNVFEEYLASSKTRNRNLYDLLLEYDISLKDISECVSYNYSVVPTGGVGNTEIELRDVDTFIKNAFGRPYIPGASLKGMLRTALLSLKVTKNPNDYLSIKKSIERTVKNRETKQKGRRYLKSENSDMESEAFHTLERNKKNKNNAVNSSFRGLIVSDSEPLELSDLTLGQKIDVSLKGKEKPLPIFREMLKPGVKVQFTITLDEDILGFSMDEIFEALNHFHRLNDDYFYSRFQRRNMGKDIVYLGGGVGFSSKTVVDALFPKKDEGLAVKNQIFKETLGRKYSEHHHEEDVNLKIAPHMCKCTRYNYKLYNVGIGQLSIIKQERI